MAGADMRPVMPMFDIPRLPDGSVNVPALCRQLDEAFNEGVSEKPSRITEGDQ